MGFNPHSNGYRSGRQAWGQIPDVIPRFNPHSNGYRSGRKNMSKLRYDPGGFNPHSNGYRSGRRADVRRVGTVETVSILILMDTAREGDHRRGDARPGSGFNPHSNGYRSGSVSYHRVKEGVGRFQSSF